MRLRVAWVPVILLGLACSVEPIAPIAEDSAEVVPDTAPPQDTAPKRQDTGPTPSPGVDWVLGEEQVCSDPDARNNGPLEPEIVLGHSVSDPYSLMTGGGLAVADFDGDGALDLVLPNHDGLTMFRGAGDRTWTEGTQAAGLGDLPGPYSSVTAVDVEGDGDLDMYVTSGAGPDLFLLNSGVGAFEAAGLALGLANPSIGVGSAFADWDLDGDLDAFVSVYGGHIEWTTWAQYPSHVYQNDGGMYQEITTEPSSTDLAGFTFLGAWLDVDDDWLPELYLVNDFGPLQGHTNTLLSNQGGHLTVVEDALGLDVSVFGMGLAVADVNDDERLDVLIPSIGSVVLLESAADGRWYDQAAARGLQIDDPSQAGWGVRLADLDNDGDLDVVVGFGQIYHEGSPSPDIQPDRLWLADAKGQFVDAGAAWGWQDSGRTRSVLTVDLDGDGWLDLLRRTLSEPATLHYARCGTPSWITITVRDGGANPFAVGGRVVVRHGDERWSEPILAGGVSVASSMVAPLHVGLGNVSIVDEIEVYWPDGERSTLSKVPTRRHIEVTRQR